MAEIFETRALRAALGLMNQADATDISIRDLALSFQEAADASDNFATQMESSANTMKVSWNSMANTFKTSNLSEVFAVFAVSSVQALDVTILAMDRYMEKLNELGLLESARSIATGGEKTSLIDTFFEVILLYVGSS